MTQRAPLVHVSGGLKELPAGDGIVFADGQASRAMLIDCGSVVFDMGNSGNGTKTPDYANGSIQKLTATANFTLALPMNFPPSGNRGVMILKLVNFGNFTVTWNGSYNFRKKDGTTTNSVSTWLSDSTGRTSFQAAGTDELKTWSDDASSFTVDWA